MSSCTSEKAGLSGLNEGAKVSYEEMSNRGKTY
jgi:cold shock protein